MRLRLFSVRSWPAGTTLALLVAALVAAGVRSHRLAQEVEARGRRLAEHVQIEHGLRFPTR